MGLIKKLDMNTVPRPSFWRRLFWLVVIWSASVLALFVVASLFRLLMAAAGMKSH